MSDYAHPEYLVETDWVEAHLKDPKVRVRRGALGTFVLEIEGTNNAPKVRRVE